jgi:hypothetical protein
VHLQAWLLQHSASVGNHMCCHAAPLLVGQQLLEPAKLLARVVRPQRTHLVSVRRRHVHVHHRPQQRQEVGRLATTRQRSRMSSHANTLGLSLPPLHISLPPSHSLPLSVSHSLPLSVSLFLPLSRSLSFSLFLSLALSLVLALSLSLSLSLVSLTSVRAMVTTSRTVCSPARPRTSINFS